MKVMGINGSPRKTRNTATLLNDALEGARAAGAETELIHLYDLDFKGCASCFACKRRGVEYDGVCVIKDDLRPVLRRAVNSRAIIMGSPIYFGDVSGVMRCFMERLLFMNSSYDKPGFSNFEGSINTGFIYTMNVTAEQAVDFGYSYVFERNGNFAGVLGGTHEHYACMDTWQFDDYSRYYAGMFDDKRKAQVREKQFPKDRELVFEMGKRLAGRS